MAGKLYIVGTPIGNLEDISQRMKNILNEVDVVFAEDTRVSIKLLSHIGVSKTLISCHDYNEAARSNELKRYAESGRSVALISDAGMPLVSDPGYKFVQEALRLEMEVIGIPGPSSVLLALVGSGLPCERFAFEGFLADKAGERKERLQKLKDDDRTLIFFVSIHDLEKTLKDINEIMGNRAACICRELTKLHEEYIRKPVLDLLEILKERQLKGECVLVIEGARQASELMSEAELSKRLSELLASGARLKDASAVLAKESGWNASDVYKLGLKLKNTV
ncbi:MAG: 16S rRNA (cytidine(1402)-2'-O)-methyltransferase [Candidatus Obscuribacterales bacterium]|nr:16S rRNA (cytidine(1402)-2'-O)-methyltransferase [Candidatus Obscuribacterales bacterium]